MSYQPRYTDKTVELLFDAFLQLENKEECHRFFEDLCTVAELQAMSFRFQIAKLLDQNKTYAEIETLTGASTATISRINKALKGPTKGYRLALDKANESAR